MYHTTHARLDSNIVLDIGGFDPLRIAVEPVDGMRKDTPPLHEAGISAISLCLPGDIELERFERWTGELIGTRHEDIYRMKGIISLAGQPRRYIFHGVHALSNWQYGELWGDRPRESRMVVIGRNLDRESLEKGFGMLPTPASQSSIVDRK